MRPGHIIALIVSVIGCFAALVAVPAHAGINPYSWYIESLIDPFSRKPVYEARVYNARGYRFRIWKKKDNSIWGEFRLPRSMEKQLSKDILPVYQVDTNDPIVLDDLRKLEVGFHTTLFKTVEKHTNFIIWGAATPGFIPPVLQQLMLGEELVVNYRTVLGETGIARFHLDRANEAVAKLLNVAPMEKNEDGTSSHKISFSVIAKRYLEQCDILRFTGDDMDYANCRNLFTDCSEAPDQNSETFAGCLKYTE